MTLRRARRPSMRRHALSVTLAALFLASGCTSPLDRSDWPVVLDGKYFRLMSTSPTAVAEDYLTFIDSAYELCFRALEADIEWIRNDLRFRAILFRNKKEYRIEASSEDSLAFYDPWRKGLIGYYDPFVLNTKSALAHEVMHAFVDETSVGVQRLPPWFVEGMAEYIGNSEMRDGFLAPCSRNAPIYWVRLENLRDALLRGEAFGFDALLRSDWDTFMAEPGIAYAQSWLFCEFLMCPKRGHRERLRRYYRLVRTGEHDHDAAWEMAFGDLNLANLEHAWRAYVRSVEVPEGVEAARIGGLTLVENFDPGREKGGAFVFERDDDGVLAHSPLRLGDVIVELNGKSFAKGSALAVLREALPDGSRGDAKGYPRVVVLRDAERIDVDLSVRRRAAPPGAGRYQDS